MIAAACLALLASAPDAALACIFHNPDLKPIVLGDTGTPGIHGAPPKPDKPPGYEPIPTITCYGEVRTDADGFPMYVEWCVWK